MLYRQTYLRNSKPASVTFSAADAADAADFSELWEKVAKLPVLTLVPIGSSKFPSPPYSRTSQALPGGGAVGALSPKAQAKLTKEEQFQLDVKEST